MSMWVYCILICFSFVFFFSSRRRHTRFDCDWSSDVALPISAEAGGYRRGSRSTLGRRTCPLHPARTDRKSTRLNSSHSQISYAVSCLKNKQPVSTYLSKNKILLTTDTIPKKTKPLLQRVNVK